MASVAYLTVIAGLAVFFGLGFQEQHNSDLAKYLVLIAIISLLVLWYMIMANIYADTKKRNWPTYWIALGFFLGPIGGINYYIITRNKP